MPLIDEGRSRPGHPVITEIRPRKGKTANEIHSEITQPRSQDLSSLPPLTRKEGEKRELEITD